MDFVAEGARRLAAGEAVAFPTETVYGLGADALDPLAVAKIFALKGRPADHPLIVHFHEPSDVERWTASVPEPARKLAQAFWPGPLTMILPRGEAVPHAVTGGQETVGLRCPSHPVARELLREFARVGSGAVAAPSANKFGHVSPTTAAHVREEFGPDLFILDGGACEVGLESTIVDLSRGVPVLLRPGAITRGQLAAVLGVRPGDRDAAAPRASGTLAAHYAPRTPVALVDRDTIEAERRRGARIAVLGLEERPDPVRYGHDLYARLRELDAAGADRILVEAPPIDPAWEAVNDRLARAAAASETEFDDEP
jgi:L-threonylcarbamoyladenylate synthase